MNNTNQKNLTLVNFYREHGSDLLAKCHSFYSYVKQMERDGFYQSMYRVTLSSGLDHRITVYDAKSCREVEMICFDSNSYLGLHKHPKVIEAVKNALDDVGFGTPSAQLLCGTNQYLRELEATISEFHNREETMIFPSGYTANIGILNAILRKGDLVAVDRFSHASIHDGIRSSGASNKLVYPHQDMDALDQLLTEKASNGFEGGKLIVTDGVFSMHGSLAPLKKLKELATKHNALLMVDEAHSIGVIGPNGFGTEEHYQMPRSIDIIAGTLSKAPGAAGGYICGSKELISYARCFANAGLFTASLPAATCAGLTEAFHVMQDEPVHRKRLWKNVHTLERYLKDVGLQLPEKVESPIITVFIGKSNLLHRFSRDLFDAGIKCGNINYPAVPRGQSVIRIAVNARHTEQDLQQTADTFYRLVKKYEILNKEHHEVAELE